MGGFEFLRSIPEYDEVTDGLLHQFNTVKGRLEARLSIETESVNQRLHDSMIYEQIRFRVSLLIFLERHHLTKIPVQN